MNADLLTGWQMHQAGRAADAARCYHSLLARQPDPADALHLFGVLHFRNGYFARAVELIGRAVSLQPETAAYHANLAEAHRALGQHQSKQRTSHALNLGKTGDPSEQKYA